MAGEAGTTSDILALWRSLEEAPYRFGYFQALRRLECASADNPRLGEAARPRDEAIRLGQEPSMAFAPSTLAGLSPGHGNRPPRLSVYFLGLLGANGPLPLHLTEYARDRQRNFGDETFVRFLDLFHHRMLLLFYRAWARAQPAVSYDRPDSDRFSSYVGALCGLGMPSLRQRDAMPDLTKLHFSGRLACHNRPAEGLQAILESFFQLSMRIEQFVGHWLQLPVASQCRLGESRTTGTLGDSVIIGERLWDRQYKFRILVGPITLADYERLLPGGDSLARLVAIVRNYVGDEFAWDINLILLKNEVPPVRLGEAGRLGWTSWLGAAPRLQDADDLVLEPTVQPV